MTRTRRRWERGVDRPAGGVRAAAGRRRRWGVAVVCLGLALAAAGGAAWAAKDDVELVSRAGGASGAKANGDSFNAAVSADGRLVAFDSAASNLHPDDGDFTRDVFVRDLEAGTTTLVSRAAGASGAKANADSTRPAVSADGRFVAFDSGASNLHPDDSDFTRDVFVRDLQAGATTLVSRAAGAAGTKGDGGSSRPAVSADGRFVAFESNASNLDPDDTDTAADVFVRDLQAGTTTLVSRAAGAAGAKGNGFSSEPVVSADGRLVAFDSVASNLDPDDGDNTRDVFLRDLQANTTTLVSRAAGAKGNADSFFPAVSGDGRLVAFQSDASNLHPDDGDDIRDVFVRDLQANTVTLVSRAAGATGNANSVLPALSADGRYVTFDSDASNLHPDDGDDTADVFVRDLQANTTTLVSRAAGAAGGKGNSFSFEAAVSADGRFVAFSSLASNLHPDDGDTTQDVFRREVLGAPPQQPPAAQPQQPPAGPPQQPPAGPPAGPPVVRAGPAQPGCPLVGELILGGDGDDERSGGASSDIIFGRSGDDLLRGLVGADCVYGERGADRLSGGGGPDRLFGGRGADRLRGGAGGDVINPGSGRDRVAAGPGNDRVLARGNARDTIDCGPGRRDLALIDRFDDTRRCERVRLR
jgi:Tol biopolymer transport system component